MAEIRYPRRGDLVFCTVQRITPYAAWCKLDEYSDAKNVLEGMIHVSEVAGKWVKDIRDFVKTNKQYIARVVYVDVQKGYVNLSLKRVSKVDKRQKMEGYRQELRADNILQQVAKQLGKDLETAYEEVGYKLEEHFETIFAAFEEEAATPGILEEAGVGEEWIKPLQALIAKSFEKKSVSIKAIVDLSSLSPNGVGDVRKVLEELKAETGSEPRYVSAPKYRIEVESKDPKAAEKKLKVALEAAVERMKKAHGTGSYEIVR
jgi:translation initiation factor 2 subunit 1